MHAGKSSLVLNGLSSSGYSFRALYDGFSDGPADGLQQIRDKADDERVPENTNIGCRSIPGGESGSVARVHWSRREGA